MAWTPDQLLSFLDELDIPTTTVEITEEKDAIKALAALERCDVALILISAETAPWERLDHYLGVIPGAVTPFAVVNDTAREVKVALERGLLECDPLHFHPLENTRTTAISPAGLLDFLEAADHSPTLIDQDDF